MRDHRSVSPTKRRCVFCAHPGGSGEHLLPEWLQGVLPSDQQVLHYRQVGSDKSSRQEWRRRPFRDKTGIVCHDCNTGWMSRLEGSAKPLLVPAITQAKLPLQYEPGAQMVLATWAFKTVLVFQATTGGDDPAAPPFHGAYVFDHGEPPPQVFVWMGSHYAATRDEGATVYVQRPLTLSSRDGRFGAVEDFGYAAFLAVGGVSFLVVAGRYRNRVTIPQTNNFIPQAFIPIFPTTGPVIWPPELMMAWTPCFYRSSPRTSISACRPFLISASTFAWHREHRGSPRAESRGSPPSSVVSSTVSRKSASARFRRFTSSAAVVSRPLSSSRSPGRTRPHPRRASSSSDSAPDSASSAALSRVSAWAPELAGAP